MSIKSFVARYPGYLAIIGLVLAYIAQVQIDTWRFFDEHEKISVSTNIYIEPQPPRGETAKLASFGANEALADWYWLKLIQYYGGGDPQGKYRKLAEMFDVVTDLSPKFLEAYRTGLLILPGEGFVDEAIGLGQKGKEALPQQWELPYYTGLVYHLYKKDYLAAAREFEIAAAMKGSPAIAKLFAGIYYNQASERQTAYQIFKTIYETTDSQFVRDRSEKYIQHLDAYFFLGDAVRQFSDRFGRYPTTLEEIVQHGIIESLPTSPLNQSFILDPATGEISESKL